METNNKRKTEIKKTINKKLSFLWAKITGKPILPVITKNRVLKFIVPKEVQYNVWTINDDAAIEPAILIGPNQVPCMLMIPKIAKGLNLRKLVDLARKGSKKEVNKRCVGV